MSEWLCLSGNPGTSHDWDLVRAGIAFQSSVVEPEIETFREADRRSKGDWCLAGYSWGAYKALRLLCDHVDLKPRKILLVAPFLVTESPLSALAQVLVTRPLVSDFIIGRGASSWKAELLEKMFSPDELKIETVRSFAESLNDLALWRRTIARKIEQQKAPLTELPSWMAPKTHVVVGDNDRSAKPDRIRSFFVSRGFNPQMHSLAANHGLLWTHARELAGIINGIADERTS